MKLSKYVHSLLLSALLASVAVTGCTVRAGYRAYDPYHSDYHVWDGAEVGFYNQWAVETHHDPHRDFRKLKRDDQQAYWNWRHDHH
jgi:hypothetical protein